MALGRGPGEIGQNPAIMRPETADIAQHPELYAALTEPAAPANVGMDQSLTSVMPPGGAGPQANPASVAKAEQAGMAVAPKAAQVKGGSKWSAVEQGRWAPIEATQEQKQ